MDQDLRTTGVETLLKSYATPKQKKEEEKEEEEEEEEEKIIVAIACDNHKLVCVGKMIRRYTHVGEHVLPLVFQRVPVEFGGEEILRLAAGPGTVVRRRLGRMVDGHVRLQTSGRGEYRRAQVARERFAAGERVLD